jgi:hypothetical protein
MPHYHLHTNERSLHIIEKLGVKKSHGKLRIASRTKRKLKPIKHDKLNEATVSSVVFYSISSIVSILRRKK